MSRFIGLDVHKASTTAVVLNAAGKRLRTEVLETQASVLRAFVRSVARPRYLCFEEGTQSEWLYELLEPLCDETAVVQLPRPKGCKSDGHDAHRVAERLRLHSWEQAPIYKAKPGRLSELRQALRAYLYIQKDQVRLKNRLKAQLRARGLNTDGSALYQPQSRAALLQALPEHHRRTATLIGTQLDQLSEPYQQAEQWLLQAAKAQPAVRRLTSVPGIGWVRAASIVAVVLSPERFRTKRQFWSYCGFGVLTHSSSDWQPSGEAGLRKQRVSLTRGLNRRRNPLLKATFKGAAMTVIHTMPEHPWAQHYRRLLQQGTRASLARLTIARRIAAATLAIWKHQEDYEPSKHHRQ